MQHTQLLPTARGCQVPTELMRPGAIVGTLALISARGRAEVEAARTQGHHLPLPPLPTAHSGGAHSDGNQSGNQGGGNHSRDSRSRPGRETLFSASASLSQSVSSSSAAAVRPGRRAPDAREAKGPIGDWEEVEGGGESTEGTLDLLPSTSPLRLGWGLGAVTSVLDFRRAHIFK
jgi:hypothetical protein